MRRLETAWSMTRQTFSEWSGDKGGRLGAALSYYTVFSLAPLLLLVISIAGVVFGRDAAEGRLFDQLSGLVGADAARLIQAAVTKAHHTKGGLLGTVAGIAILLVGATGVVVELQGALNTVWKVEPKPNRGVWGLVRTRLLSMGMILSMGFLLLVSLSSAPRWPRSAPAARRDRRPGHRGLVHRRRRRAGGHLDAARAHL
jgi:membrane protein